MKEDYKMKKGVAVFLSAIMATTMLIGCGSSQGGAENETAVVEESGTEAAETEEAEESTKQSEATEPTAEASSDGDSVQMGEYTVPKGDWVIGLSNSYYGNTWRHQMVDSFVNVAEEAKKQGLIADYIVQNGDNTVNAQIDQINSFILEGVDAIVVNAASSTALNSVLHKAQEAGILVIAFDSVVDDPDIICMDFDFEEYGQILCDWLHEEKGEGLDVVISRGISGSAPEVILTETYEKLCEQYGWNIVATVIGNAENATAQEEFTKLIPSLDHVDAVLNAGGDSYGIIQAFENSGVELPIIFGDNSAEFMKWWNEHLDYKTLSSRSGPHCGSCVFWVALAGLNGEELPMNIRLELNTFTVDEATQFADMEAGTLAGSDFTYEDAMARIKAAKEN